LAFLAHQCEARRLQWPVPGGESQSPRIPKCGELHHHGLPDRGPDSCLSGFMNSTLNVEEPKKSLTVFSGWEPWIVRNTRPSINRER
jgi:hypothetical protein